MRICLWAGACAGKSTLASGVFYSLKRKNYNTELVHEYIKRWAYEKKMPKSFDQIYIFAKQLNAEDHLLQHGVEHIVTDSPMLMQVFYARRYNFSCWQSLMDIAKAFEEAYSSLNIFLSREGLVYNQEGRYENKLQAQEIDKEMRTFMDQHVGEYKVFKSKDLNQIAEYIEKQLPVVVPSIPTLGNF